MSAQPEQAARETRWVDPRALVTRANVRTVAEPDPELVASIKANGIIQPPIVYADGADLVLIAGHRRTAAAIAAGLERIEVVVGPRLDEQGRLAAQVSENTNRAGLRAVEVSDAVEQMALLGVPAGQIAKAAGLRKAQVEAARRVAAANKAVKEAIIEAPELTLDQAAELTSWGDDPDAVADLLAAAEDGEVSFAHTQARLAEQRERREAITVAEDGWIAKGYLVLAARGVQREAAARSRLRARAGRRGREAAAEGLERGQRGARHLPGSGGVRQPLAARGRQRGVPGPEEERSPEGTVPPRHQRRRAGEGRAGAVDRDRQQQELEARCWCPRGSPGRIHPGRQVQPRAGRRAAPAPGHPPRPPRGPLAPAVVLHAAGLHRQRGGQGRGPSNGLLKTTVDPTVPGNRVTGQLLAAVADAAERSLANSTWRNPNAGGTEYLTLLVAHTGYQLSDVEVLAMKATNPKWTPPKAATSTTTSKAAAAAGPGHDHPGPGGDRQARARGTQGRRPRTATPPTAPAAAPAATTATKPPATAGRSRRAVP